jgi:hypothetical protein
MDGKRKLLSLMVYSPRDLFMVILYTCFLAFFQWRGRRLSFLNSWIAGLGSACSFSGVECFGHEDA